MPEVAESTIDSAAAVRRTTAWLEVLRVLKGMKGGFIPA